MDISQLIAWGSSFVLGIGAVSLVIKKYSGKVKKAVAIATEALNIVNDVIIAIEADADGKITITEAEVAEIVKHVNALKEDLRK